MERVCLISHFLDPLFQTIFETLHAENCFVRKKRVFHLEESQCLMASLQRHSGQLSWERQVHLIRTQFSDSDLTLDHTELWAPMTFAAPSESYPRQFFNERPRLSSFSFKTRKSSSPVVEVTGINPRKSSTILFRFLKYWQVMHRCLVPITSVNSSIKMEKGFCFISSEISSSSEAEITFWISLVHFVRCNLSFSDWLPFPYFETISPMWSIVEMAEWQHMLRARWISGDLSPDDCLAQESLVCNVFRFLSLERWDVLMLLKASFVGGQNSMAQWTKSRLCSIRSFLTHGNSVSHSCGYLRLTPNDFMVAILGQGLGQGTFSKRRKEIWKGMGFNGISRVLP